MWMDEMLYDVTHAPLTTLDAHVEKTHEQRGSKTVTTIRPAGSAPLQDRAKSAERHIERAGRPSSGPGEAVQFRREETSLHRLYRSVRETEETSRAAKIEELRQAVKNETYRPNLMIVAERLLSLGELGRF